MSEHDESSPQEDDLEPWAEDDLVRALRAPASPGELAQQQAYVAAYRHEMGPGAAAGPRSRAARRLAAGGTAVVLVALSGGVAAAYTGNLPQPMQQLAHTVMGAPAPETPAAPAGAPSSSAAPHEDADTAADSLAGPGSVESPNSRGAQPPAGPGGQPSGQPSAQPSAQPSKPPAADSGGGRDPGPDGGASPTPQDDPTSAPPPAPPALATIAGGSHLAGYGQTVRLTGRLSTSSGLPVAGYPLALQVRRGDRWQTVTRTATGASGTATATSLPVGGLEHYRWRTRGVHSRAWQIKVRPTLSASATVGDQDSAILATAVGASPGDGVVLYVMVRAQPREVARARVTADGSASFAIRTPARRRVFVVRLLPTASHVGARARVLVTPPSARGPAEPGSTGSPQPDQAQPDQAQPDQAQAGRTQAGRTQPGRTSP